MRSERREEERERRERREREGREREEEKRGGRRGGEGGSWRASTNLTVLLQFCIMPCNFQPPTPHPLHLTRFTLPQYTHTMTF